MYQKSSKLVVQNLSPQNCSSSHWVLNKNEMLGTQDHQVFFTSASVGWV